MRTAWCEAIGWDANRIPKISERICSLHFTEKDFNSIMNRIRLNENAIPVAAVQKIVKCAYCSCTGACGRSSSILPSSSYTADNDMNMAEISSDSSSPPSRSILKTIHENEEVNIIYFKRNIEK